MQKPKLNKFVSKQTSMKNYKPSIDLDSDEDEDDDEPSSVTRLGYFKRSALSHEYTIYIDEDFGTPAKYRNVCNVIANATEDDVVKFEISSYGGRLDGLTSLLSAMLKTDATTECTINGACKSAAVMLALHCDNIMVSPFADVLVHHASYGTNGKASDVLAQVTHTHNYTNDLFRSTFKNFLTEDEIELALNGKEFHMQADEFTRRLKIKMELEELEQKDKPEEEPTDESEYD